jgi:chemotaxis protein MotB
MADEDQQDCNCPDEGLPSYMGTFADLMALLMCFFILLLSFSEMDVIKYKQVAGSMKDAFGVQRTVESNDIPKGTSIIAQEFSAGKPTPTILNVVEQQTTDQEKRNLDFTDALTKSQGEDSLGPGKEIEVEKIIEKMNEEAEKLKEVLAAEITQETIQIKKFPNQLVIRLREKRSFSSGEAILKSSFYNVLDKVAAGINVIKGDILVSGHTDNNPIKTRKFTSNWALSAARSANVVEYLINNGKVNPARIQIRANADQEPLVENTSVEGRAENRRVEIIVLATKRKTNNKALGEQDEQDEQ